MSSELLFALLLKLVGYGRFRYGSPLLLQDLCLPLSSGWVWINSVLHMQTAHIFTWQHVYSSSTCFHSLSYPTATLTCITTLGLTNYLILWYCRLLWLSCGTSMTLGRVMNDPVVIYYDWLIQLVHEADTFVLGNFQSVQHFQSFSVKYELQFDNDSVVFVLV